MFVLLMHKETATLDCSGTEYILTQIVSLNISRFRFGLTKCRTPCIHSCMPGSIIALDPFTLCQCHPINRGHAYTSISPSPTQNQVAQVYLFYTIHDDHIPSNPLSDKSPFSIHHPQATQFHSLR